MKTKEFLFSIAFAIIFRGVAGFTSGADLYENIENCPFQLSGYDCSIPYEQCKDGNRKCFNNSICVKNQKNDPVTGDVVYGCDCSFATGISDYAGYECEHSATVRCQKDHFCTNGGKCGSYLVNHQHYIGCHCPDDFAGKHCQYLKETMEGFLEGEVAIPEVADDFYAAPVIEVKESTIVTTLLSVAVVFLFVSAIVYVIVFRKQHATIKYLMSASRVPTSATEEGELA